MHHHFVWHNAKSFYCFFPWEKAGLCVLKSSYPPWKDFERIAYKSLYSIMYMPVLSSYERDHTALSSYKMMSSISDAYHTSSSIHQCGLFAETKAMIGSGLNSIECGEEYSYMCWRAVYSKNIVARTGTAHQFSNSHRVQQLYPPRPSKLQH